MRSLLKQQGLWELLTAKGKAKKADEKDDEWVTLDEKAHSTIMLCLSDDVIIEVADRETAATLWMKLEKDEDAALILLVSLPESYENFVESFMTGKEILSLEDVRSTIHIREDRQQEASSATESHASGLSATGTGQKKCGKKKSKSKGGSKEGKKEDANGLATVAEADDSVSAVCLALFADDQPHNNDVWIFYSGASYHLCPHMEYFTTFEQIDGDNITMANNVVCKMTKNLISVSTFDSKGFSFKGERGVMHIMNGSKVVLTALKREDSGSVDKQVELQVTDDQSESQPQGGDDQHTTAETTGSDIHLEARPRSIAIDRARRTCVKPPQKYGFEDMLAYAL
ncbi:hypothetical protein SASPL_152897 [Salvia splendens]|uniref:Retrovirus-related Pol polyprotein from transposon TNT 1-94-like beta-barrel domain-containing protein n=1 Tax=Salvia splendens TaxID=180675 RepID=A0A8X8W3U9_SALSN|nr:hypothetical protein SASPL_152897 [Salvia splendens]